MTPLQLVREAPVRNRSWPPYAWAIVGSAAVSMFVAVTLLAWQASRTMTPRRARPGAAPVCTPMIIEISR